MIGAGEAVAADVAPTVAYEPPHEVVAFSVQGMDFCIGIDFVREIRGWAPTTRLPHAPGFVTGVINLRGTVVAVIDLASRLGLGATMPTSRHVIIIIALKGRLVGLLADTVSDILTFAPAMLRPLPDQVADPIRGHVSGIVTLEQGRMLRMLNLEQVVPSAIGGGG